MRKPMNFGQPCLVVRRLSRVDGCQRNDRRVMARPDLPDMQIGDAVTVTLDRFADFAGEIFIIRHPIQQYAAGVADQSP